MSTTELQKEYVFLKTEIAIRENLVRRILKKREMIRNSSSQISYYDLELIEMLIIEIEVFIDYISSLLSVNSETDEDFNDLSFQLSTIYKKNGFLPYEEIETECQGMRELLDQEGYLISKTSQIKKDLGKHDSIILAEVLLNSI